MGLVKENWMLKEKYDIQDLLRIMELLRSPEGCPWDREQTHASIRSNFIEETYEAVEAIDTNDSVLLQEELGDVLLQVVFHSRMEEEAGRFDFGDVVDGIVRKLIERHPHVFSDVSAQTTDQVLTNWEAIKQRQKQQTTGTQTLESVPKVFPALMRAQKVQKRASKAGMDWKDASGAFEKITQESAELYEAAHDQNAEGVKEELGDLLFSVVNVARFLDIDAEEALQQSTQKFISRFKKVEQLALSSGIDLKSADTQTLDRLWETAKNNPD